MTELKGAAVNTGSAGERLKAGREAAGLDLADIASRTRIPQRHLEAIESDDFHALPSPTYSVGFAKAFARATGQDEVAIAAAVREQLEHGGVDRPDYRAFEPADPARVPPRLLAWTAAIVAVVLLAGYGLWRAEWFGTPGPTASVQIDQPPIARSGGAPAPAVSVALGGGPVVLTAIDAVWLKVTDTGNVRLLEREMKPGETFQLPEGAKDPRIVTGRPQALRVTVGGVEVPPLGVADKTIKNVAISAAALAARPAPPAPPSAAASPTPAAPRP